MPARQLRSLRPASFLVGLGLLAHVGCSSSSATSVAVTHPTMVEVAPENFLGDLPCSEGPGLKRYVATLFDTNYVAQGGASGTGDSTSDGGAAPDFQLPSSLPTPCLAAVGFGLVVAGRHYDVKIDGYDTDDLAPRASGSRQMVSPAPSMEQEVTPLATPRWTAHCDDAIAVDSTIVRADHCTPFTASESAPGSVHIGLGQLLAGLSCGDQPGQVDHFDVSLSAGGAPALVQSMPCTADAAALFSGVAPQTRVSAYVSAFSADGTDAFAGATCGAFTRAEGSVNAECTSLSQVGTMRVDLQGALALLGLTCDKRSVSSVTVQVPGDAQVQAFPPPDCEQPFTHGFAPGAAVVTVEALGPSGSDSPARSLTCGATITPGQLALAECTAN